MPTRKQLANAIRALSMDAVQQASSGHPGMPMGMADIAEVLWNDYLVHNPANPKWYNRDRFVLSNGHGSMLLYSLLHLTGYALSIDQLKRFRQIGSQTPGHPEYGMTVGVETTTGPLGQGLANAVGMAIAEVVLAARFNTDHHKIIDHYTYVFVGDGCLMEGISHEACSLAGHLQLGKLIVFYDDNGVSIDGNIQSWFTDLTPQRFTSYGWQVIPEVDGHDADAVGCAIEQAQADVTKPSLICCKTVIGYGAPNKQSQAVCHGAPLGDDEVAQAREQLGWSYPPFEVPDDIREAWDARAKGEQCEQSWNTVWEAYRAQCPDKASEFSRCMEGRLPTDFKQLPDKLITDLSAQAKDMATRKSSLLALGALSEVLPELIGGSADLAESNCVLRDNMRPLTATQRDADYIYYGVREFAMTAISTGIALHGGLIPYAATFLVFSDYARNAIRMAALMEQREILIFTHDSVGLGEDGPTHQPIEHLSTLRAIPNLDVWRPCDSIETVVAWQCGIEKNGAPTALVLSRQTLPQINREKQQIDCIKLGGYILHDSDEKPVAVIIATGSEVSLALKVSDYLAEQKCFLRVVSMPCCEVFNRQSQAYQKQVLPVGIPRIAIEAGSSDYWQRYVDSQGMIFGIDRFGASAPAKDVFEHCGFTAERISQQIFSKLTTL